VVDKKKRIAHELVLGYLENISSKVFSDYPKEITALVAQQHGVYALYKGSHLYYVGLATNLKNRVKHHLQDKHSGKWDKFSLYLVRKTDHIKELESLILRIADPKGNAVKGRLPRAVNLSTQLRQKMQSAHDVALAEMLGEKRKQQPVSRRETKKHKPGEPPLAGYIKKGFPIRVVYKGTTYNASVRINGTIKFDGKLYNSPSVAGCAIIQRACNGWWFWRYKNSSGEWVRLNELRKKKK
jgi:hypothetical protein